MIAGAYFVFRLTGFGSTVIALPVLVLFFPLKFAVSLLMLLDLAVLLLSARACGGPAAGRDRLGWFRSCSPAWRPVSRC